MVRLALLGAALLPLAACHGGPTAAQLRASTLYYSTSNGSTPVGHHEGRVELRPDNTEAFVSVDGYPGQVAVPPEATFPVAPACREAVVQAILSAGIGGLQREDHAPVMPGSSTVAVGATGPGVSFDFAASSGTDDEARIAPVIAAFDRCTG